MSMVGLEGRTWIRKCIGKCKHTGLPVFEEWNDECGSLGAYCLVYQLPEIRRQQREGINIQLDEEAIAKCPYRDDVMKCPLYSPNSLDWDKVLA